MKKLLILSALLAFAYAGNAAVNSNKLMKKLVMNQRLLTGLSHANYSLVTHKMHARVHVIDHTFLNNLRLNANLFTSFLNTTLTGTINYDSGDPSMYGETMSFDIDVTVDNDGIIHETDTLNIPSATWPTGMTLNNSQIHVYLSYWYPGGSNTNTSPYVENYPGIFDGGTNLSYDYEAADLAEKQIDFDWGDAETYQPARTIYVDYPFM